MQSYTVGGCEVRPDERRVIQDGKPAALGARAFDILLCLIEHRDRMVGKDELMRVVWPDLVVEENNLTVHVSALRKLLGHQAIATIPGRGYRFAMEVSDSRGVAASPPTDHVPSSSANGSAAPTVSKPDAAGSLSLPDKPSIAVLPFASLGDDANQAYFTDGVTEDVITELSRFRSLFVIARNSSFSYRGRAMDVRVIARELGVRYVLEGSIRRAGQRMRVTAQLCDAVTGAELWAERYERALEDIFAVQEELTRAIVSAIAPQIESSEFRKLRTPTHGARLSGYELAMRARDMARQADRDATASSHDEALRMAEEAVALDAECGEALTTIAYLHWRRFWAGDNTLGPAGLQAGLTAARRALNVDSSDHLAHLWKGMLLMFSNQHAAGLADLRRAHDLNPNDALTLSLLGQYEAGSGRVEEGVQRAQDALRLSPRDPMRWSYLNSLAWAHFASNDLDNALAAAMAASEEAPHFYPPHLCLAVCHAGLDALDDAAAAFDVARGLAPQRVDDRMAGRWHLTDDDIRRRATTLLRRAAAAAAAEDRTQGPSL